MRKKLSVATQALETDLPTPGMKKTRKLTSKKYVKITLCPICEGRMDAFMPLERGRCSECGADTEDFVHLLTAMTNLYGNDAIERLIERIKENN